MTTRYVDGLLGNDANDGLAAVTGGGHGPKLTLNGAEDTPVVAGDTIWVRPGVYRETLTCDVSGGVGTPITYVGDVAGEIWGMGGDVRITGSNNDTSATRPYCINLGARVWRTFRGLSLDTTTSYQVVSTDTNNISFQDCVFSNYAVGAAIYIAGASQSNVIVDRCKFIGVSSYGIIFIHTVTVSNTGHTVRNCVFIGLANRAISISRIGGISIINNAMIGTTNCVRVDTALAVGQTITVNNNLFHGCGVALQATAVGEITSNYNNFWSNTTNYTNVTPGLQDTALCTMLAYPVLYSGQATLSGFRLPSPLVGELSQWSQLKGVTGTGEPPVDIFGLGRPVTNSKNSWGAVQYQNQLRDMATVRSGTSSLKFTDAGRQQIIIPVEAVNTTISVYCYREANYTGTNPQMILKQPGQADIVVTDAGAAGVWNLLTHTWVPAVVPNWITIELVSNNTALAGAYSCFFDDLLVSPLDTDTMEAWTADVQHMNYAEEAAVATAAFSPVGGTIVGA